MHIAYVHAHICNVHCTLRICACTSADVHAHRQSMCMHMAGVHAHRLCACTPVTMCMHIADVGIQNIWENRHIGLTCPKPMCMHTSPGYVRVHISMCMSIGDLHAHFEQNTRAPTCEKYVHAPWRCACTYFRGACTLRKCARTSVAMCMHIENMCMHMPTDVHAHIFVKISCSICACASPMCMHINRCACKYRTGMIPCFT
jgi:hypothetical protein